MQTLKLYFVDLWKWLANSLLFAVSDGYSGASMCFSGRMTVEQVPTDLETIFVCKVCFFGQRASGITWRAPS